MDFNVFIGARAGVSKNVAVNGNATTGLAITPKMEKAKKSLEMRCQLKKLTWQIVQSLENILHKTSIDPFLSFTTLLK